MKAYNKFLVAVSSLFAGLVPTVVFAQEINTDNIVAKDTFGNIADLATGLRFVYNLLRYLGWAGVLIGIALAIFGLIYKLMNSDNEETMANVQGYITKAVIIVIAGILLISAGFFITFVSTLIGLDTTPTFDLDTESVKGS